MTRLRRAAAPEKESTRQQKTRQMAGRVQLNIEHLAPFFHEGGNKLQGSGG
jgi:hypothetical protein